MRAATTDGTGRAGGRGLMPALAALALILAVPPRSAAQEGPEPPATEEGLPGSEAKPGEKEPAEPPPPEEREVTPPEPGPRAEKDKPRPDREDRPRDDLRKTPKLTAKWLDRVRKKLAAKFKVHCHKAYAAFRTRRYETAVEECRDALDIDPENLAIQRLHYSAKIMLQKHRLELAAQEDAYLDDEMLAEVDRQTRGPERPPDRPRPDLPLWSQVPESEGMRRMRELLNQRINMTFVEADLDYVLSMLFKISGVDILADQGVIEDKTLNIQVRDMPLRELLKFIERNFGDVKFTVTENAVWITSPDKPPLVPKIYPLSHGLLSQSNVATGVRSSRGGGARGGGAQRSGSTGGGGSGQTFIEQALTWVEGWEDEWPQGSKWYLDLKTNTLLMLTTEEMHKHIEELLAVIDVVPVMVLVRTKFIEVLSSDLKEAGLENILYTKQTDTENTTIGDTGMGEGGSGFQISYATYLTETSGITAAIRALVQKRRTKVLSAPQIIAMNNMKATIDISKSFSYASQYQATNTTIITDGGGSVPAPMGFMPSSYDNVDVGFFMEFTPSVGRDMKTITIDLHATVDDVVGGTDRFEQIPIITPGLGGEDVDVSSYSGLGGGRMTVQRPVIDRREFTTRLMVRDGGAVIIGGLLKNYQVNLDRRIPILGDIPLIGLLFRYKKRQVEQSNLIIVVQADIVTPEGGHYAKEEDENPGREGPALGLRSTGPRPNNSGWIRDVTPEVERGIFTGVGR